MPVLTRFIDCSQTFHSPQDDRALLTYLTTPGLLVGRGNNCERTTSGMVVTIDTGELSVPFTKTGENTIWAHVKVTNSQQVRFDAGSGSDRYDALVLEIFAEGACPSDETDAQDGAGIARFSPVRGSTSDPMTDEEISDALGHDNWRRFDDVSILAAATAFGSGATLENQLTEVDLSDDAKGGLLDFFASTDTDKGASQVGLEDAGANYDSDNVEDAMAEIPALIVAGSKFYGDGSDGTPDWSAGANLNPASPFNFIGTTLPVSQTLSVSSVNAPLVILNTGNVTINGTVDLNSKGGPGGGLRSGAGNGNNGTAGNSLVSGWTNGAGTGATANHAGGGGGASSDADGVTGLDSGSSGTGTGGSKISSSRLALLANLMRAVVCGGGGASGHVTSGSSPKGGDGGGALLWMIGGNLTLGAASVIRANGESPSIATGSDAGGPGAGAGGTIIIIVAGPITNSGTTLSASGGTGANGRNGSSDSASYKGGNGAAGKVIIISLTDGTVIAS